MTGTFYFTTDANLLVLITLTGRLLKIIFKPGGQMKLSQAMRMHPDIGLL